MKYKRVTVGGTFDRLHAGHKTMLSQAFAVGEHVWIGVTSSLFFSSHPPKSDKVFASIEPFETRLKILKQYLQQKGWLKRATVLPIDDRFGTTLIDESLEAIIVSPETELVATEINLLRAQKNWPALEVILVPWVLAQDNKPINSVRIRNGEIDREGHVFSLPKNWGVRKLPLSLRQKLKRPFGKLISNVSKNHLTPALSFIRRGGRVRSILITVGDAVTVAFLQNGITPDISIVDLKVQRKQVYKNILELGFRDIKVIRKVKNASGTISYAVYTLLNSLIQSEAKPAILQIDGEEDLLALLAIFLSPLNSLIVYGQPGIIRSPASSDQGIVMVEVTEEKKHQSRQMLQKFIQ